MPDISIEQLTLSVPSMPESRVRQLALGIAQSLAAAPFPAMEAEIPALRIDLTSSNSADDGQLARRVVAEILQQIRRQS